jgi:phytoene synthase
MAAPDKLAALEEARSEVLALGAPGAPAPPASDPVLVALADSARRFPVPLPAFGELIDGCVADTKGATYTTFDDLHDYCRCVAGSIGRLSLGVFGSGDHPTAESLADSLGVALQLTNILRDIREDYQNGRVYLPAEDLDRFGVTLKPSGEPDPAAEPAPDAATEAKFVSLIEFEAERARQWYDTGLQLLPMLDARSAACTGAMAGIYRKLLDQIIADPAAVLHGRLSLSPGQKAMVAVRSLARPLLPRRNRVVDPTPPAAAAPAQGRRP